MRIHSARLQFHKSVEFILFSVYNQVVVPACMHGQCDIFYTLHIPRSTNDIMQYHIPCLAINRIYNTCLIAFIKPAGANTTSLIKYTHPINIWIPGSMHFYMILAAVTPS